MSGPTLSQCCRHSTETAQARQACFAEYVWIGGTGSDLRSKTKVLRSKPAAVHELPVWHFDCQPGGLTHLQPRTVVPDPFRGCPHILVLCDIFCSPSCSTQDLPARVHPSNNRFPAEAVLDAARSFQPVFNVEQQYTLLDATSRWPVGAQAASPLPRGKPVVQ